MTFKIKENGEITVLKRIELLEKHLPQKLELEKPTAGSVAGSRDDISPTKKVDLSCHNQTICLQMLFKNRLKRPDFCVTCDLLDLKSVQAKLDLRQ
jgi:hypothetical protein